MHSTIKGPYRKQTKYIRKHAHFSNTYLEKAMEKQPKHHAPPGFHTLFEEYCSFVLGDFQGQMSHCLEFSSSMAVFPLLPYELPRQGAACVLAYRSSANRTSSKWPHKTWNGKSWGPKFGQHNFFPFRHLRSVFLLRTFPHWTTPLFIFKEAFGKISVALHLVPDWTWESEESQQTTGAASHHHVITLQGDRSFFVSSWALQIAHRFATAP